MRSEVRTWHHGLVARWWAELDDDGEDAAYFAGVIRRFGEPALDAGCGTGRVLLPLLRLGLDVDGLDASRDMLEWCRRLAAAEGLDATLHAMPLHELDVARRYRVIFVCGSFGIGGTREDDLEGLRRIRRHLEPGSALVMDHYLPNVGGRGWRSWTREPDLPSAWSDWDRQDLADDSVLAIRTRTVTFDPLDQTTVMEMEAARFVDDETVESERHEVGINIYFKGEIELLLRQAGFETVDVTGALEDRPALPWTDPRIVFTARVP